MWSHLVPRDRRHNPASASLSVLVVDDEPAVREFLARWLAAWGYSVKVAANASEALEVMLAEPVPIMVCDIKMPGHDGLWLAERVRQRWPQTAIIMATGAHAHDLAAVVASHKLGVVDYIMKPFEREMLGQALRRAGAALEGCNNT
ncbi:MAG: response regulator [Vicinamibacterales bacterium]